MRLRHSIAITSLLVTFLSRSAAGYNATTCPGNGTSLAFVTWSASLGCSPPVCGACQLTDIAGVVGSLPVSLAARMPMYDTDAVRSRMTGLRATFLGDSTMVETVHDLAILLSGENWMDAFCKGLCCPCTPSVQISYQMLLSSLLSH